MASEESFLEVLRNISSRVSDDMSEQDVENAFLNESFFQVLGYKGSGYDLRSEFSLPDDRRPDYVTIDDHEAVTAVYEFKKPSRDLQPHESQLSHYATELKSDYGVLTNGLSLRLYRRDGGELSRLLTVSFSDVSAKSARNLEGALRKPVWDITDPGSVNKFVSEIEEVALDGELGREHFFDTFRLEEGSPFADLVTASMDLLHELRDEREAKFVTGAYDFWEASYASEPDEVPGSWEGFIDGKQSLRDFMFCLETGHALLARLLLAKACEDHDFFPRKRIEPYFDELQGFGGEIDLDAYPVAANGLMEDMRGDLVESLFEDDIFIWWTDGYQEETSRGHATPYNQFREVAEEGSGITRVSPATRERFSRAVAHVFFSVLKFDFSRIEGDPLGDLYQRYFDPETRKALGEFYTPQEVVEYIMDGVEYDVGVSNERLIDPACGSGTFLVEAVRRYLRDVRRYNDDPDWEKHLTELCSRPHIVGLDIHPFAVLMAQIRFMVEVLPEYREAKMENPDFTIRRLPIFRTDSLRNERESVGADLGEGGRQLTFEAMTEDNQDVLIPVPLPVEVDVDEDGDVEMEDGFLVQRVRMPLFDNIRLNTGVGNFGEYFAALQGVLDVVKFHMAEDEWSYVGGLEQAIGRYSTREYEGIEEFFAPYVDDILSTVQWLREEHGDGRLFKMFEDSVLALVVKNYMQYEYVVGNPPYVRVQHLPDAQKKYLDTLYKSTTANYDIYCVFYERGMELLSRGTGELGFITSNQFLLSNYGEGIRTYLLENSVITEVYDFRDSGVFQDAANLPVILFARDEPTEENRQKNQIKGIRVKSNIGADSQNELDTEVVRRVRKHHDETRYSDDYIDIFDFPQSKLDKDFWSLMPPDELAIFEKLDTESDYNIEKIMDSVFAGTQTSANDVYIVTLHNADYVGSEDQGGTVEVVPIGYENEVFEIETDLLRPWLQGIDVHRWRGNWSGQHVIMPYYIEESDGKTVRTYSTEYLKENCPLTWDYFENFRDVLESREGGRMRGKEDWYAFIYPKNHERFEDPKIITADMSDIGRYMIDEEGEWYFKAPYGLQLLKDYRQLTKEVACQLNSKTLDFYLKHIAPMLLGGKYRYQARYIQNLPAVIEDNNLKRFGKPVDKILETLDLDNKTSRFPEAYLGDFTGELEHIDYVWQTRRYPVDAEIQERTDGTYAVTAGRSDAIADPAIDSEERARYVHAAVDGRNVKKGEETSIPIPRRDSGVEELLEELEEDRRRVEETDIEELEREIDEIVYDLFDLTKEERGVIEEYLEVF